MNSQPRSLLALSSDQMAGLVGSRLCHDLVSPLGAIGNGIELLQMSGQFPELSDSPEMALITEALHAAQTRIQAFRMAFGHAPDDQRIGLAELQQLMVAAIGQDRITVHLEAGGDFARPEVRMVLLALMCLESAMPWGGRVMAVHTRPGWRLVGESKRMKADAALWAWLEGGQGADLSAPPASHIHFALLAEAATTAGRQLQCEIDADGAEIRL